MIHFDGVLRDRVRDEAARYLRRPLLGFAIGLAISPALVAFAVNVAGVDHPPFTSTIPWAMVTFADGLWLAFGSLAALWGKKDRYSDPLDGSMLRRLTNTAGDLVPVLIATVAIDPSVSKLVGIEGRVTTVPDFEAMLAPISGSPCLYFRVVVEQYTPKPYPQARWSRCGQSWQLGAFLLTDDSGSVLVEARDEALPACDDVNACLSISSRTTLVESASGVSRLPPHVRRYIEANSKLLGAIDNEKRIRVIELTLVAGDHVSLFGHLEERVVSGSTLRSERIRVVASGSPMTVFAARLDELRWLGRFHRRFTLALILTSMLGFGVTAFGIYLLLTAKKFQ